MRRLTETRATARGVTSAGRLGNAPGAAAQGLG